MECDRAAHDLHRNATPVPVSSLYFGFMSLAVYDAVVTIEGRYTPYAEQPRPHAQCLGGGGGGDGRVPRAQHVLPGVRGGARSRLRGVTRRHPERRREGTRDPRRRTTRRLRSSRCARATAVVRASRSRAASTRACGVRRPTPSPRCSCRGSASSPRSCWTRRHRSHWRVPTHSTPTRTRRTSTRSSSTAPRTGHCAPTSRRRPHCSGTPTRSRSTKRRLRDQATRRQLELSARFSCAPFPMLSAADIASGDLARLFTVNRSTP